MDCSPQGSSVHRVSQTTRREWAAFSFSRGSFKPRDHTYVSCFVGAFFTTDPRGKTSISIILNYWGFWKWTLQWWNFYFIGFSFTSYILGNLEFYSWKANIIFNFAFSIFLSSIYFHKVFLYNFHKFSIDTFVISWWCQVSTNLFFFSVIFPWGFLCSFQSL